MSHYRQRNNDQQWDPSLSILPMVMQALPAILEVLNSPVIHHHTHTHELKDKQPQGQARVNPYRNGQGIPATVGELESWLLSRPLDPESDKLLQMLAQWPQDTPTTRIRHLLT